jgi:hypothetical protein
MTNGSSPIFILYGFDKSIFSLIPTQCQLLKNFLVSIEKPLMDKIALKAQAKYIIILFAILIEYNNCIIKTLNDFNIKIT